MPTSYRFLFHGVAPLAIALSAVFLGQTASNLFEQTYIKDNPKAGATIVPPPPAPPKAAPRSKDSRPLMQHNMFCSDCAAAPEEGPTQEHEKSNETTLPLRLIATSLAQFERHSFASILNTHSQRHGAYQIGQEIPNAGIVERIGTDYLEFRAKGHGGLERVFFDSGKTTQRPASRTLADRSDSNSLATEYVRSVDPTHFEVDRKLIRKLQDNPALGGARARPISKDGHMDGVRMYGVRSNGLAHSVGLRNGDIIVAANGVKLQSMEAALELMGQLKTKDHWSIEITRANKPVTLQVDLQ